MRRYRGFRERCRTTLSFPRPRSSSLVDIRWILTDNGVVGISLSAEFGDSRVGYDRRAVPRNAEKSAILSRSVLGISSSPGNDLGRF